MNIEFISFKDNIHCHSTTFPDNITLRIQEIISLPDFTEFLVGGSLLYPGSNELYVKIDEIFGFYIIEGIRHVYRENLGHVILVTLEIED